LTVAVLPFVSAPWFVSAPSRRAWRFRREPSEPKLLSPAGTFSHFPSKSWGAELPPKWA
jgi:hypothetical protein